MISKIFFYLCLSFILGITLSFLSNQELLVLIVFGTGLILVFSSFFIKEFYIKQKIKIISLLIIIFLMFFAGTAGWLNYDRIANPKITSAYLSYFNDYPERVEIKGKVKRVEERVKNNRLIVEAEKIKINNQEKIIVGEDKSSPSRFAETRVEGKVMVFVPRLVEVNYGDLITLKGRLKTPEPFEGFNWPMHLANDGIRSIMFRPWVTVIEEDQGSFVMEKITFVNLFFQEKLNRLLAYPESAILSAMLLGNRGEIPQDISADFSKTGIAHIIAISGLHVTIISAIFFWILLSLGLWRKHAFILASLLLFFFIIMVGAPPSAIRAGIMGFLFLLAQYFGRGYSSQNAIIIAATGILIFQPLSLFYCVSFQFSFTAILAILLLFPIFRYFFYKKLNKKIINPVKKDIFNGAKNPLLAFFLDIFLISAAILLFLGPLIAYYFGHFPVISLLANLLVIPLLPFILFFGIVFLFVSIIFPPLALIFSSIVYLLLSFLISSNSLIAAFPFIEIFQFNISVYWLIIYYIILFAVVLKLKKITSPHPLKEF